jgi:prepilin-type N-terminal cleavage/methylation domain-containing protein
MKRLNPCHGFTLIELVIVVAAIGILASVAIPTFETYMLRSKTSEAHLALSKIVTGETAYFHSNDVFISGGPSNIPPSPNPVSVDFNADAGWRAIGFGMGASVYFGYQATVVSASQVDCEALGDLNGNGVTSLFRRSLHITGSDVAAGDTYIFDELE